MHCGVCHSRVAAFCSTCIPKLNFVLIDMGKRENASVLLYIYLLDVALNLINSLSFFSIKQTVYLLNNSKMFNILLVLLSAISAKALVLEERQSGCTDLHLVIGYSPLHGMRNLSLILISSSRNRRTFIPQIRHYCG